MDSFFIIISLLKIAVLLGVILFMVSYAVYAERRVSAFIQDRVGPNRVGPAGLFQPIADMFKLLLKEDFTPRAANTFYYWLRSEERRVGKECKSGWATSQERNK